MGECWFHNKLWLKVIEKRLKTMAFLIVWCLKQAVNKERSLIVPKRDMSDENLHFLLPLLSLFNITLRMKWVSYNCRVIIGPHQQAVNECDSCLSAICLISMGRVLCNTPLWDQGLWVGMTSSCLLWLLNYNWFQYTFIESLRWPCQKVLLLLYQPSNKFPTNLKMSPGDILHSAHFSLIHPWPWKYKFWKKFFLLL